MYEYKYVIIKRYAKQYTWRCRFVTFDFRQDEDNEKKHIQYINDNKDKKYVLTNAGYFSGGAMYAIMNRKSMKLYLDNQHKNIVTSDWVKDFWTVSSLKNIYLQNVYVYVNIIIKRFL